MKVGIGGEKNVPSKNPTYIHILYKLEQDTFSYNRLIYVIFHSLNATY